MKITDIQAIPLNIPQRDVRHPALQGPMSSYHVLVKVFTDEGIVGVGEAYRLTPGALSRYIEEALKPLLIGQNPMHVDRLWDLMYQKTFLYGRKGFVVNAISGVELALWDIIGKARNLPVYEMIGGLCRDKIQAYASLPHYNTPKECAEVAVHFVEKGYKAIKLHHKTVESVKLTREAVGPDITLMLDVNGAWNRRQALAAARELEKYDLLWLEEPVSPMDDYDGLAYVRENSNVQIAAGENEYTHYGFKELISKGAADIVQPDAIKSGGISACRKIFAIAEAWNVQICTHSFYFGPGVAATLHLCLSNLRSRYIEIHALEPEASFIQPALRPEKGFLAPTTKPGLGIEIDEDVVKRFPYTGP